MRYGLAVVACIFFAASGFYGLAGGEYKTGVAAIILAIANALLLA